MRVLDTDHCVAILRGQLSLRGRIPSSEQLAITAINVGELAHGAHRSSRPTENLARLDLLLAELAVVPYDDSAARVYGRLRADLERSGAVLSDADLQIASMTLLHDAQLITHNRRHFERVPGLVIEDWIE